MAVCCLSLCSVPSEPFSEPPEKKKFVNTSVAVGLLSLPLLFMSLSCGGGGKGSGGGGGGGAGGGGGGSNNYTITVNAAVNGTNATKILGTVTVTVTY